MIQVQISLFETSGRPGYHLTEQDQGNKTRMGGIASSFFTHLETSAKLRALEMWLLGSFLDCIISGGAVQMLTWVVMVLITRLNLMHDNGNLAL